MPTKTTEENQSKVKQASDKKKLLGLREKVNRPISKKMSLLILLLVILVSGAFSIYLISKSQRLRDQTNYFEKSFYDKVSDLEKPPSGLKLISPVDNQIIIDDQLHIKGTATPQATVLFFTDTDTGSIEADEKGNFEGSLTMANGINTLTITAITAEGEETTVNLNIVYDEEQAQNQQVMGVKKEPPGLIKKEENDSQAIIGKPQRIDKDALVIETESKKQKKNVRTEVDRETKIVGQDKKQLRLDSLQPTDLVAVIATDSAVATDSATVKKALKIFVKQAEPAKERKRRAVHGVITGIEGNLITLNHQTQHDRTFFITTTPETEVLYRGTLDISLAELQPGYRIAAVGDLDEESNLIVRRIHVIPGKAIGLLEKMPEVSTSEATNEATHSADEEEATDSAEITPSPSATPTANLEPSPTSTPSSDN